MNKIISFVSLGILATSLAACGSDEKTTIVHERPVVVQQQPAAVAPVSSSTPSDVENACAHGYDNHTHSCY